MHLNAAEGPTAVTFVGSAMKKICIASGEEFEIGEDELEFLDRISPVYGGRKFLIPPPDLCPQERARRRFAYRNLRSLYRRKCDFSGKSIISPYAPDSAHTVYQSDIWWSDQWDGMAYGREFDFSRTFFEQFAELFRDVPVIHHYVTHSENCEYINGAAHCRNCYLCYDMDYVEDSYYLSNAKHVRDSLDCLCVTKCELCYQCIDCEGGYSLLYSNRCIGCSNSYFLNECRQCKNCIACSNLVNKEYYIFNEKSSREEFEQLKKRLGDYEFLQEFAVKAEAHHLRYPRKNYFGHSNEDSSGDNIQLDRHDLVVVEKEWVLPGSLTTTQPGATDTIH